MTVRPSYHTHHMVPAVLGESLLQSGNLNVPVQNVFGSEMLSNFWGRKTPNRRPTPPVVLETEAAMIQKVA